MVGGSIGSSFKLPLAAGLSVPMKTQKSVTRAAASRAATPQITFIEDDGEARFTSRGGKHHLHLRGETSRMAREMAERAGLTVEEFVVRAINARHAALVPPVPPTSADDFARQVASLRGRARELTANALGAAAIVEDNKDRIWDSSSQHLGGWSDNVITAADALVDMINGLEWDLKKHGLIPISEEEAKRYREAVASVAAAASAAA